MPRGWPASLRCSSGPPNTTGFRHVIYPHCNGGGGKEQRGWAGCNHIATDRDWSRTQHTLLAVRHSASKLACMWPLCKDRYSNHGHATSRDSLCTAPELPPSAHPHQCWGTAAVRNQGSVISASWQSLLFITLKQNAVLMSFSNCFLH